MIIIIRLARFPDNIPYDFFFISGFIKNILYKTKLTYVRDLKQHIPKAFLLATHDSLNGKSIELDYCLDMLQAIKVAYFKDY